MANDFHLEKGGPVALLIMMQSDDTGSGLAQFQPWCFKPASEMPWPHHTKLSPWANSLARSQLSEELCALQSFTAPQAPVSCDSLHQGCQKCCKLTEELSIADTETQSLCHERKGKRTVHSANTDSRTALQNAWQYHSRGAQLFKTAYCNILCWLWPGQS